MKQGIIISKQLIDLDSDVYGSRVLNLLGRRYEDDNLQVFWFLLYSSAKKFKESDLTKNLWKFTWSDLYNYYENDIFLRSDSFGRNRKLRIVAQSLFLVRYFLYSLNCDCARVVPLSLLLFDKKPSVRQIH